MLDSIVVVRSRWRRSGGREEEKVVQNVSKERGKLRLVAWMVG